MNTKDLKKYVIDVKSNLEDCLKKLQKISIKIFLLLTMENMWDPYQMEISEERLIENRDLTIKNITNLNSHFFEKKRDIE